MKESDMLMQARAFLGTGSAEGNEICCCCGQKSAAKRTAKVLKSSFTDTQVFSLSGSAYVCDSCLELYTNPDMRFKIIFSDTRHTYQAIDRERVLEIIKRPPELFVLSCPYNFKKHHWLRAGLSTSNIAYIGTDSRTVMISYRENPVSEIIDAVTGAIQNGMPRSEILSGRYSIMTMARFNTASLEKIISPMRYTGAVELFVKYTPAVKSKIKFKEAQTYMLTASENNAVLFLKSMAMGSGYRANNGIQFWNGFFERRINRFKDLESSEFASRLTEAIGTRNGMYTGMLQTMSDDDTEKMMQEIRNKTHLLVAICYSERGKE